MNPSAITSWFNVFDWSPTDPSWAQRRKATWAWRKFKKARRWARVLRFIPFVRMIAIGNSLGYGNCSPESDIDLVIVTAPRHIWTVRLLVVALLRLFRQRPGEHTRDAICPSFFLTTEALDLEQLQLQYSLSGATEESAVEGSSMNWPSTSSGHTTYPPDPYLLFWLTQLTILYDEVGTYDTFWRANEHWVRRWLPEAHPRAIHPRLLVRGTWLHWAKSIREWILGSHLGDALERWSRRFQEQRFSPEIRTLALARRSLGEGGNQDSRVIVNDRMLKFHTNDRRAHYREQWVRRLAANESSVPA